MFDEASLIVKEISQLNFAVSSCWLWPPQLIPLAKGAPVDQMRFLLVLRFPLTLQKQVPPSAPEIHASLSSGSFLSCFLKPLMTLCPTRPAPSPPCHIQFIWRLFSGWLLMFFFSCRKYHPFLSSFLVRVSSHNTACPDGGPGLPGTFCTFSEKMKLVPFGPQ